MTALADAVRQGKALYVGLSNYRARDAGEAIATLRSLGTPCLIHQSKYSMLDRGVEQEKLLDLLGEAGVGCIAYSPLHQGVLTDKYLSGIPEGSRAQRGSRGGSMGREGVADSAMKRVRLLEAVARRLRIPLAHLALKWVLRDGGVASALIGARTVRQLDDSLEFPRRAVVVARRFGRNRNDSIVVGDSVDRARGAASSAPVEGRRARPLDADKGAFGPNSVSVYLYGKRATRALRSWS